MMNGALPKDSPVSLHEAAHFPLLTKSLRTKIFSGGGKHYLYSGFIIFEKFMPLLVHFPAPFLK
jgi:hypothetical protein